MTTPRDVTEARAIIDCADDGDLLVGGETYYGGEVCSGVEVAHELIAAALSERERETVETCCKAVCAQCSNENSIYSHFVELLSNGKWAHRKETTALQLPEYVECQAHAIRADAARRETP